MAYAAGPFWLCGWAGATTVRGHGYARRRSCIGLTRPYQPILLSYALGSGKRVRARSTNRVVRSWISVGPHVSLSARSALSGMPLR